MQYIKLDKINLKNNPIINEKWVQFIIANNPSILGLGEILLKDIERKQLRAGRLDLLFKDKNNRRYCVELHLGKTDESHIISTIEYRVLEKIPSI
jgi:RecB family endonuclease NucS